ncbi:hypothetical protein EV140_0826 [Microcella alkaliphila]|uniref:Bacterial Ig domain-containing protein n=1 Tax=Microcella alkaliphila TaxID=279828 RepID=A0A4Q7TN94_9MICO|nr:hypothetical protein [Microcella alkaliphila]RZT62304.1 hypothetical protein EV140_0826 [Microcella alkaliphila]
MRPARHLRGAPRRRSRILAVLVATVALAALLAAVPAAPAQAAAAWDLSNNAFIGQNVVELSGTKDEGSELRITRGADGSGDVVCVIEAGTETFTCGPLSVPNGINDFGGVVEFGDGSTTTLTPLRLRVLGPPTVSAGSGSPISAGRVVGQGQPGARLQVQTVGDNGAVVHACPDVLPDGFWSCALSRSNAPSGEYSVSARQGPPAPSTEFSIFGTAVPFTIDREPPEPPRIFEPSNGTSVSGSDIRVRGTAEANANVQVFVNAEQRRIVDATDSGEWDCIIRITGTGNRHIQALQRDAAGNFSAPTQRIQVTVVGQESETPTPSPSSPSAAPGPTTPSAPGTPDEPDATDGNGEAGGDPDSNDGSATPSPPPGPNGSAPPAPVRPDGPAPNVTDTNWGTPTTFGASLPTAAQVWERGGWLIGLLVGIGYLVLVAWPMRLVTQGSLPRLLPPGFRLTGRNRAVADDDNPVLPGWFVAAGVLGGATLVAALSGGIDLEVRYLRLMAAIGAALLVLNLVAVVIPARVAGRLTSSAVTERLLPSMLIAATITALLSRLWDLQPPILVGVLVATTIVGVVPRSARAGVAIAQTTGVAVVALAGWAIHDVLTPAVGFWANLAAEGAAALALGGFGSIVLLLLPVGPFPGRTLYTISRLGWAVVTIITAAVGAAVAVSGPSFPIVPLAGVAAAFGAVCLAVVAWTRWVEPSLR